MKTLRFVSVAIVMFATSAHAEIDPWTTRHWERFEQRWANNPDKGASQAWRDDMNQTCTASFVHAAEIGIFSEGHAAREIKAFCNY